MKKICFFVAAALFASVLLAQNKAGVSSEADGGFGLPGSAELPILTETPSPAAPDGWHWGADVVTFLRDAAFALPYTAGYTATGYFLAPYVRYSLSGQVQLTAGVHMAGVAGCDGLRQWQPMVRMEYSPVPAVRIVMGTLYGALSHRMYEPMFDRERYIYDHQEEGVQLRVATDRFWSDTWLHWENLLEPWQADQERFTLASNNEWKVAPWLSLPFSFLGSHRGGQFSALDTCIESLFNESAALRFTFFSDDRLRWCADIPFFWYQDVSPTKCQSFDNGWALWPQLSFDGAFGNWRLLAGAGYWRAHHWVAPRGSYLFQSISWRHAGFVAPERQMATLRLAAEYHPWQQFACGADAEAYFDLVERGLDFVFGVYMRLKICR